MAVPALIGQDADAKSQTCLDPVRRPVAQPPVQAGQEASLEIQRAKAAGRPCYEADRTSLAAKNSVGEPAANWAPNVGNRERERGALPPPIWSLSGRKAGQGLFAGRGLLLCFSSRSGACPA
jgi:hypothetical protein